MVVDAARNYLQLATGLTEVTVGKARQAAGALLAQADAMRETMTPDAARKAVTDLADELIATSKNNRDLLLAVVRSEAERVIDRIGVATRDEIEALDARVRRLDERLDTMATAAPKKTTPRAKPAAAAKPTAAAATAAAATAAETTPDTAAAAAPTPAADSAAAGEAGDE